MSQTYLPVTPGTPGIITESQQAFQALDIPEKFIRVQDSYVDQKDRLVTAIDSTQGILGDLKAFNKEEWVVRYPQHNEPAESTSSTSLSSKDTSISPSDFRVLRLDLKLGSHNSSSSATSLVSQLEKASVAHLLDERIGASLGHMDRLRRRVEDTSSKVLVTGDLNAGKSTFVNALLRRPVMPVDQQPCTTAFCEVHDAAENNGTEEVHLVNAGAVYNVLDEQTYTRAELSELEEIVAENESCERMIKVYLADTHAPSESLLNNGVVDISLIDAPGLNRDSIKTTALFARQEEIDVVVFVVSAENHFTLSAKEFLGTASNEKAYVFIVVNKYDQIKNKDKCRRLVLEQIKQLSPRTYDDASNLVHFVDSVNTSNSKSFDDLQESLRSFVLVKRSKSKLQPVSTYLANLLSDVELLAGANIIIANEEMKAAQEELALVRPVLEKMKSGKEALDNGLENVEEEGVSAATAHTKAYLTAALAQVAAGTLPNEGMLPTYPGLLGIWNYARSVRRAMLASLDTAVRAAEDEARGITSVGVKKITLLGEAHLPIGVERSRRVFMPEAMFASTRHRRGGAGGTGGAVVAGGMHGLGIGLASRTELLETSALDIFDAQHQFWLHFGESEKEVGEHAGESLSALSIVSVGLGTLTMVGGQAMGARAVIECLVRVGDLLGNAASRKWAAPVLGVATIGCVAYVILELPRSVPRTIGRRVAKSVSGLPSGGMGTTTIMPYVEGNAGRVSKETRKVLRLAAWDLKERFRGAMEERGREVKGAEESERRAVRAVEAFGEFVERARVVRVAAQLGGA